MCRWVSAGSMQNLVRFFQEGRSPWVRLLVAACDHWNLKVENDAFLGKGTFGRVFRGTSQEEGGRRIFKAIKIVLPGDNGAGGLDLLREKESLNNAAKVLPNAVARVEDFHDFGSMGAALLLADIGSKVPQTQWRQLFETLGSLHEQNILHGDPRLANAIYVQGEVRWIDFRSSVVAIDAASVTSKRRDIAILIKSCCDKLMATMGTDVEEVVREYDGTAPSAVLLYEQVIINRGSSS
uniref:Protein kinase domain-containing protein n=1 Tax=Entomoneis paludosa TaxID=265537 RepID=A0A7S3DVK4_9STRA